MSASKRLLLLLLISLPMYLYGQVVSRRDGNWWIDQSRPTKLTYMLGFFDGMDLGGDFSYWDLGDKNGGGNDPCISKAANSYYANRKKYLAHITNDQLSDGLDEFYKDYRNRRILVHGAVWLVVNGIAGTPQKELDKMIESWRRNAGQE